MEGTAFDVRSLPNCDGLFDLGSEIGSGVASKVYTARERRSGRSLAAKIVKITPENEEFLQEECRILHHLPKHDNIIDVYGLYLKTEETHQEVWIVTELCTGTAIDFVRKMRQQSRPVTDSHLSHILKGLLQGLMHLHANRVVHRDVRGSNVLITRDGEIRLADFGVSKVLRSDSEKARLRVGSPNWMAPEMVPDGGEYDCRVDVWAMGITAMELADGVAPFGDIHPSRALFQISRNPPPSLMQPANRSQTVNDFINECLEKNPENRPVAQEFPEHPLFQTSETITNVLTEIVNIMKDTETPGKAHPEVQIRGKYMKIEGQEEEEMLHDDLAMLEDATEESILKELEDRLRKKNFCTFLGDVLLVLNPNETPDIYNQEFHERYRFKARSDNSPHVYAIADSAYQEAIHHEQPQQILITGETMSGKTTNMLHILDHLLFLGQGHTCGQNVRKSVEIVHALGNGSTMSNRNSTRHVLQTQLSFTATGKTSGAIFWIYQLEKNRVTSTDRGTRNFHIFYYFYHGLQSEDKLAKYFLESEKSYEFLRSGTAEDRTPKEYAEEFAKFEQNLKDLGFADGQVHAIRRVLAAILILGEVEFGTDADGNARLVTQNESDAVAELLGLDQKKFSWALLKYCVVMKGEAAMRYHTEAEATEAKNVLARGLYFRLVDWIVNNINEKLSIPRAIYGEKYTVNILDLFGFECSTSNTIDQLIINTMNEQLQFFYSQKIFSWEMKNAEEEEVTIPNLQFNDNKIVIDQLLSKPDGLMHLIDDVTKSAGESSLTENLKKTKHSHISVISDHEFTVAHYTGKVKYNATEIADRNRDFLPPEMIETMRRSSSDCVRSLFTGMLTTTGNLTMHSSSDKMDYREGRWNTGFSSTNKKFRGRKFNTSSKGQYSQSRQMRTAATTFRATCLEILRSLTANETNMHFVKCIRTSLSGTPYEFQRDIIRQQIKAFGGVETIQARQKGYSYRVTFSDFIRRYRFLAFDFNENVEETKENCRLLFLRLKMEGWVIGKTKLFLKYYDKEYLSRLYGMNVRKIVKVQSMMRAFLARRDLQRKIKRFQQDDGIPQTNTDDGKTTNETSETQQTQQTGEEHGDNTEPKPFEDLDQQTITFIKPWFRKWKEQSMYQVLLLYKSTQQRNFVYFCQQIHLYNQNNRSITEILNEEVDLSSLDLKADPKTIFPEVKISVNKAPFRLSDINFADSSYLCPSVLEDRNDVLVDGESDEEWDAPLKRFFPKEKLITSGKQDKECQTEVKEEERFSAENNEKDNNSPDNNNEEEVIGNVSDGIKCSTDVEQIQDVNANIETKYDENARIINDLNETRKPPKYIGMGPKRNVREKYNTNNDTQYRNTKNLTQSEPARYKTPIRELEERFKTCRTEIDDSPYNFRALLRKTNFSYNAKTESPSSTFDFTLKKVKKTEEPETERKITCTELAPGLVVEGEIADL